jgi:NAD+ synthase (glutamine-hydrolysing)
MPYEILNFIERLWVHENKSTAEIHLLTAEKFPEYPTQEYVQKYIRLFNRNQWKRERIAPSFHVDTYNLDPRSGFRYPIINGEDSSTPEA